MFFLIQSTSKHVTLIVHVSLPHPAVYKEIDVVKPQIIDCQFDDICRVWCIIWYIHQTLPGLPNNTWLKEFEDVQEDWEEYDREDVNKQPLLEARIGEMQCAGDWNPEYDESTSSCS